MWAQPRHDQVRRQVEDDVADVEQRQTRRDLVRRQVQDGAQVVAHVRVHRLREPDVGADRRAQEVQRPEGGDDAAVKFSAHVSTVRCL